VPLLPFLGRARKADRIRVHVLVRGRIGDGWYDIDEMVELPAGTTLAKLVADGDRHGLPLAAALRDSPHLSETLMWNGERCPVAEHGERALADGDELYLLAPLAGG
jgi:molybdopterin converting factor small subunit